MESAVEASDPFSAMDPFGGGCKTNGQRAPVTPPKEEGNSLGGQTGAFQVQAGPNAAGGFVQQQQQQQQHPGAPMQVSPELANSALAHAQAQQQAACGNYQVNPFEAMPPVPSPAANFPAPQEQATSPQGMAMGSPDGGGDVRSASIEALDAQLARAMTLSPEVAMALSPPISPLLNPASPLPSPPPYGLAAPAGRGAAIPSMPAFDGAPQNGQGFALSPGPPAQVHVANPFEVFDSTPSAQQQTLQQPMAANPTPGGGQSASVTPPSQPSAEEAAGDAQFWSDMGFGSGGGGGGNGTLPSAGSLSDATSDYASDDDGSFATETLTEASSGPIALDERGLPAGGEYYTARVTTPMLGAIFSSGRELASTLFQSAGGSFAEAIGDRPVISFTIDGSAADTAGIRLGHVLLKVNGDDVRHTDDAVRMVGNAPRPMTMEFYVPDDGVEVVKTEGMCMVKYDNNATGAPSSSCEWKPKYVVVGDMLGKPHVIYMYRSKVRLVLLDRLLG